MTTEAAALQTVRGTCAAWGAHRHLAGLMRAAPMRCRTWPANARGTLCWTGPAWRWPACADRGIVARLRPQWGANVGLVPFTGLGPVGRRVNGTAGHMRWTTTTWALPHARPPQHSPVVPTALAASAPRGCSGRQLLDAWCWGTL